MNCGDATYRSTLDAALRGETRGVDPKLFALVGAALAYLTATPGVLQGAWDTYLAAPQMERRREALQLADFKLGRKLATGGFGEVYRATLSDPRTGEERDVILKKANQFGEAEVWMNERLMRSTRGVVAEFIQAFDETGEIGDPLWLAWAYEGDFTLFDLMSKGGNAFPFNTEPLLLGRELEGVAKDQKRAAFMIRLIMQQLIEALGALHGQGIVHRDVKPQNMILSTPPGGAGEGRTKLIDLGAAADLRVGINFQPDLYLLDPRFCPPQQYLMSQTTPPAPPAPVAAFLSPVLWRLNTPDRFDMYSAGMVMLQMVFAPLRSDSGIQDFKEKLDKEVSG